MTTTVAHEGGCRRAGSGRCGLLVLSFATVWMPMGISVFSSEITVKKSGGDHAVIQDTLDAAVAGDTVTVFNGTYSERLYVDHGGSAGGGYLTLRVNPGDAVALSGGGTHNSSFLRLLAASPAVDAGDPDNPAGSVAPDAEGRLRPINYRTDIGAFEYPFEEVVSSGSIHEMTGTVVTSWTSVPGGRYRVERTDGIVSPSWIAPLPTAPATGAVVRLTESESGLSNRFYRCVRELP